MGWWNKWSANEIAALRYLVEAGHTRKQIATHLGRPPNSIRCAMHRLDLYSVRHTRPYTALQLKQLAEMRGKDGRDWNEIAATLGRSVDSVISKAQRAGIRKAKELA